MLIRATRKLRINALLLGLGVLLVTLGFNVLLSVSTLNTLATDMVLSGYRSGAERLARDIERGMRFGKPLASFAGMDEMLAELGQSAAGIKRVTIIDARGSTLYVQPAQDSKADSTLPSGATSQTSEDKDGRTVAASLKAGVAYITKAIEFLQSTEPQDQAARP